MQGAVVTDRGTGPNVAGERPSGRSGRDRDVMVAEWVVGTRPEGRTPKADPSRGHEGGVYRRPGISVKRTVAAGQAPDGVWAQVRTPSPGFRMNAHGYGPKSTQRAGSADQPCTFVAILGTVSSAPAPDRKSTRLNSSHSQISYAVF